MVAGFAACQWPEGELTCRLLEAGARLAMLGIRVKMSRAADVRRGGDTDIAVQESAVSPLLCGAD